MYVIQLDIIAIYDEGFESLVILRMSPVIDFLSR